MFYNWFKIIHVISAAALLGTGVGTTFYLFWGNFQKNLTYTVKICFQVLRVDYLFTGVAGVVQPITGFIMIYAKGYSLTTVWWITTLLGYSLAGMCWFATIYLQTQCRDLAIDVCDQKEKLPQRYYRYFTFRCVLNVLTIIILMIVFYYMTNFPQQTAP